MACRSLWLNSPVGSPVLECQVGKGMSCESFRVRSTSDRGFEKAWGSWRALTKGIESHKLLRSESRKETFTRRSSSSSSPWGNDDGANTAMDESVFEGSPEGSASIDGDKRTELMNEVMRRLSEEDLEEAAKKYNYEDELFAQIDFAQINAFTKKPFRGNPAAVCYLPYERNDDWLKLIAKEFNLPATAFVIKRRQSKQSEGSPLIAADETGTDLKPVKRVNPPIGNEFDIRWFTTDAELGLCGHATLASAHMLFSSGLVEGDTIIFHSKKGTLRASKVSGYDHDDEEPSVDRGDEEADVPYPKTVELGKGVVELDFPLSMAAQVEAAEAGKVSDALEVAEAVWVGRTELGDYLVEFSSSKEVELLHPNYQKIKELGGRGVIATARAPADSEFDVISRFFAPNLGINEDPVTGSAHTTLGPYWAGKLGKKTLEAYQASARGGQITVRVDDSAGRVYLQGGAVLVMAGTLLNTFCE